MEYPRTITLEDKKLRQLLQEKEDLILEGREASQEVEDTEKEMAKIEEEIKAEEKKIKFPELEEKAIALTESFNALIEEMEAIKKETFARIKTIVPPELYQKYEAAEKTKKELEEKRNKIGLKVQKKVDKIIPLTRKLMEPFLENEYEDYDTIRIESGQIIATIFNNFDDFQKQFLIRKAKKK